ncbi:hypothetical protein IMZ48_32580, partial [Candidatus Bathyarchaeota archaeon]|nr:hypothetical protein [Candidatus Bathyarchaeota archaeon]
MNGFSPPRNPYAQGYPPPNTGGRPMAEPYRRDQSNNPSKNASRATSVRPRLYLSPG